MFSLYATKNLMTGEGGFATTDDDAVADRLRLYRNHGMRVRYHHESLGTNFKPTDLAAAIGLAQLARLDERTERRRHNAAHLTAGSAATTSSRPCPTGREHVWHQYTMRFPGERQAGHRRRSPSAASGRSSTTRSRSTARRTSRRYVPGAADLDLPVTNRLPTRCSRSPSIPMLSDEDLATIVAAVREVATPVARSSRHGAAATAPRRPRRPRLDGPQPPAASWPGTRRRVLAAVADPDPDALAARHRADRRRGLRGPARDDRRGASSTAS